MVSLSEDGSQAPIWNYKKSSWPNAPDKNALSPQSHISKTIKPKVHSSVSLTRFSHNVREFQKGRGRECTERYKVLQKTRPSSLVENPCQISPKLGFVLFCFVFLPFYLFTPRNTITSVFSTVSCWIANSMNHWENRIMYFIPERLHNLMKNAKCPQ